MTDEQLDWPAIRDAARRLERGDLVAFPTETVYGLGADAENRCAVTYIYEAKGRPSNHPVIVHVAPEADLSYWVKSVPEDAHKLIAAFWPGPLTLILKRADNIPDTVSGGQDSIGIRCPSHPVAQALLRTFKDGKGGVAAPSANRFGHVSPTTAQHVRDEFGPNNPLVSCVLDGGQSDVGIESTIVDLSRGKAVLLRPGHIDIDALAAVLGYSPSLPDAEAPRVSGALDAHYAPSTPVVQIATAELKSILARLQNAGYTAALMHYTDADVSATTTIKLSQDASAYAHDLYAGLRKMDEAKADVIVVEMPPAGEAWRGINDRLRRAAHDSAGILERLLKT
ncbi:MAG: L-threonylcarbamoyladenylate synthase [Oxalicibacterium faecigallinarum]|uniref:L-threonylcarbamoyladenylate synthase n=1 Tax=Oxalicibacterium faecigallinarum TaxID=573741 RepID=UPI002806D082|nr:L-threonylcarbamoyladenylate synthase [Oxalicibacterium faecigallinarum]MDQ7969162.1 L-threonylcarbamoyladenylate synthase [Oxalicibacterium faecigallinarum]